jgi:excinuclease ABC subunit B
LKDKGVDIDLTVTINEIEQEMIVAANNLEFEKAALLRDQVRELKRALDGTKPNTDGTAEKPIHYGRKSKGRGGARRKVAF